MLAGRHQNLLECMMMMRAVMSSATHASASTQEEKLTRPNCWAEEPQAEQRSMGSPHTSSPPGTGPLEVYKAGIKRGIYRADGRQAATIAKLQALYDNLSAHLSSPTMGRRRPSGLTMVGSIDTQGSESARAGSSRGGSWWSSIMGGEHKGSGRPSSSEIRSKPTIMGLYMYGGVGCGKTMLMDVFVNTCSPDFKVTRTHFHDFMLGVHSKLRQYKGSEDPLRKVADNLVKSTRVLALDEFFVTDVADATILNRLFSRLWDRGLILVATSNRAPDKLYEGGLQRNLFLPFIAKLKVECEPHDMQSPTDYRKLAQHQRGAYFVAPPSDPGAVAKRDKELRDEFVDLSDGAPLTKATIEVMMGRMLDVPVVAGQSCMFPFEDLCGKPVAAADYLAVASNFHTVAISGVPAFKAANRSTGYRFVQLIDVFYEHKIRLLLSAEALPIDLFSEVVTQQEAQEKPQKLQSPDVIVDDNLGFAKDRTISRLMEMQSLEYQLQHAQSHAPENMLALEEALAKSKKQQ
jgi:protein AFG1